MLNIIVVIISYFTISLTIWLIFARSLRARKLLDHGKAIISDTNFPKPANIKNVINVTFFWPFWISYFILFLLFAIILYPFYWLMTESYKERPGE